MNEFRMDLHIHTCLSPCADPTMLPTAIIKQAKERGLGMVGICDHNSTENISAVKKAGEKEGIAVLGGMEVASSEEVHILTFFEDDASLYKMQGIVYKNLPGCNDVKDFGEQVIVDQNDMICGINERLLIGSTSLSVEEVVDLVHELKGLAIASHVDRESFGIIGQLGMIPEKLSLDALEVSANCPPDKRKEYAGCGFPLVSFSDAHLLCDIGKVSTRFILDKLSFPEIAMALRGIGGRRIIAG